MSWHYSRALVAEYSAESCSGGEPSAPLNGTPTPAAYYWPDKTTGHSRLSRFGMTSEPLTADRGEALLMLFLADSRARTSAQQEAGPDLTESEVDSGAKWQGSFTKYDPATRSWKTRQFSLLGGLVEFSETWPRWGLMRNGECWERPTLAPRTAANESGLWPTPTARDWRSGKASKATMDRNSRPLSEQIGGQLNPNWVEWLMGWPPGWTDLKPLEMDKCRNARLKHGGC